MNRNRTVAGLDVHKDSIYLCIMQQGGAIIFEKTYGTLTPELGRMCLDMLEHGDTEAAMESTAVCLLETCLNELYGSMELKLVNPFFIQHNTKKLDARSSVTDSG